MSLAMFAPSEDLQTPLRKALFYENGADPGTFSLGVPSSLCFGVVVLGGFVVSFVHKAAVQFVIQIPKKHHHVRQVSVQFFRPVLPDHGPINLKFHVANPSKAWTTLQFDVTQKGKVCVTGFITLTDLLRPGHLSATTGWNLSPPPPPLSSTATLADDTNPDWVSYTLPFGPAGFRRPQSYIRYFYPVNKPANNCFSDQWITPAWSDKDSPEGAVWTDDLIHFALDNVVPLINDIADKDAPKTLYQLTLQAAFEQRQARLEGRDDRIVGEGLQDHQLFPYIVSTMSMSSEVFKPLPTGGTKWLFARAITKSLQNDRTDYDVYILDSQGDLVASSQQTMHIVPYQQKRAKKAML